MKQALIILAVLVLAGLGFVLTKKDDNKNTTNPSTSTNASQQNPSPSPNSNESANPAPATAKEITYSNDGFSPNTLTVKSGDSVTIKNTSSSSLQFQSDPHPQHTDDPELNVGLVEAGQSKTFTVTKKGSHGYHNHLNSGDTGTLVVE